MPARLTADRRVRAAAAPAWMVPLGLALASTAVLQLGPEPRPVLLLLLWLAVVTPLLVRIDVAEHRLPNRIVLPPLAAAVPTVVFDAAMQQEPLWGPLGIGVGVGVVLYACAVFGGLGMGDVKLGALLGLVVGCFGVSAAVLFMAVAICSAGMVGVVAVAVSRFTGGSAGWRTRIPFGPFLLLGCWCAVAALS